MSRTYWPTDLSCLNAVSIPIRLKSLPLWVRWGGCKTYASLYVSGKSNRTQRKSLQSMAFHRCIMQSLAIFFAPYHVAGLGKGKGWPVNLYTVYLCHCGGHCHSGLHCGVLHLLLLGQAVKGLFLATDSIASSSIWHLAINPVNEELQHLPGHRPAHMNVCAWLLWPLMWSEEFMWKLSVRCLSFSAYEMLTMQWWLQMKPADFLLQYFTMNVYYVPRKALIYETFEV